MVKLVGHEVWRGGEKIGWIEGNHVFARDGRKLGFFEGNFVYDEGDKKLAYIQGDFLFAQGGESKTPLETISADIEGGVIPSIAKAAIYILLGS